MCDARCRPRSTTAATLAMPNLAAPLAAGISTGQIPISTHNTRQRRRLIASPAKAGGRGHGSHLHASHGAFHAAEVHTIIQFKPQTLQPLRPSGRLADSTLPSQRTKCRPVSRSECHDVGLRRRSVLPTVSGALVSPPVTAPQPCPLPSFCAPVLPLPCSPVAGGARQKEAATCHALIERVCAPHHEQTGAAARGPCRRHGGH